MPESSAKDGNLITLFHFLVSEFQHPCWNDGVFSNLVVAIESFHSLQPYRSDFQTFTTSVFQCHSAYVQFLYTQQTPHFLFLNIHFFHPKKKLEYILIFQLLKFLF